ncbi:MAG: hypothetical protein ACE5EW_00855 [Thermoplasmata archaeon]
MIISVWRNRERRWPTTISRHRWHPLPPEPSRALQALLPVVGATLGAILFTVILEYVVVTGGGVLFVVLGILLPASLAFFFHPTLYVGARPFQLRKAAAPPLLAALGAGLGLASGPLGYLLLVPIWTTVGAVQVFRAPKPAV